MKRKVFVFGNPLVEQDSLALKVAECLQGKIPGVLFKAVDALEQVKEKENLYIMDVALGAEKVRLLSNLDELQTAQPLSGHDFDLAMELKLLRKVGKLKEVKIISIPASFGLEKATEEVEKLLRKMEMGD